MVQGLGSSTSDVLDPLLLILESSLALVECFAASVEENELNCLTVSFSSADKRSYRLLFVPFLTLSCFDNPVLIFLGAAGTL